MVAATHQLLHIRVHMPRKTPRLIGLALSLALPPTGLAQGRPLGDPEIVGVLVAPASSCLNLLPSAKFGIETARVRLKEQALKERSAFRLVGVSITDEPLARGAAGFKVCGAFDEVAVPSTFFQVPAANALVSLPSVSKRAPLLMVYRQRGGIRTLLKSVHGWPAIIEWANAGAPIE